MRYARQLLAFLSLAVSLTAQSKVQSATIGPSSVWQLSPQFMTIARAACDQIIVFVMWRLHDRPDGKGRRSG
jgi:hypothetical protein